MNRFPLIALLLAATTLSFADAGRTTSRSYSSRSSSSRSYSTPRSYSGGGAGGRTSRSLFTPSRPRVVTSPPRVSLSKPAPLPRRTVVATPAPRRTVVTPRTRTTTRTMIVHHNTYSSAFPYFYLGYYWSHPQSYYPSNTVFLPTPTDDAAYYPQQATVQPQVVYTERRGSFPWGWLIVGIVAVSILGVLLARKLT